MLGTPAVHAVALVSWGYSALTLVAAQQCGEQSHVLLELARVREPHCGLRWVGFLELKKFAADKSLLACFLAKGIQSNGSLCSAHEVLCFISKLHN